MVMDRHRDFLLKKEAQLPIEDRGAAGLPVSGNRKGR